MRSSVVKRSIVVAGHKTSASLEDAFWKAFKEIADGRHLTSSELVAAIDSEPDLTFLLRAPHGVTPFFVAGGYWQGQRPTGCENEPAPIQNSLNELTAWRSPGAPRSGRGGRRFKSCHSDQLFSTQIACGAGYPAPANHPERQRCSAAARGDRRCGIPSPSRISGEGYATAGGHGLARLAAGS
jgi:hypothetical protein